MSTKHFLCSVLLVTTIACAIEPLRSVRVPKEGFVPNASTAVKIGLAVCEPVLGTNRLAQFRPLTATLNNDIWIVEGSMPIDSIRARVPLVSLAKEDGRIIRMHHLGAGHEL